MHLFVTYMHGHGDGHGHTYTYMDMDMDMDMGHGPGGVRMWRAHVHLCMLHALTEAVRVCVYAMRD